MRILIYKRTHRGDPDANGIFGINGCMGVVRDFHYDAVIGVGGIGAEPRAHNIAGKVNWVGIRPRKFPARDGRTLVAFDHFLFYDTAGPDFVSVAPTLATRIYRDNVRILLDDLNSTERKEAIAIMNRAYSAPRSRGILRIGAGGHTICSKKPQRLTMRCSERLRASR